MTLDSEVGVCLRAKSGIISVASSQHVGGIAADYAAHTSRDPVQRLRGVARLPLSSAV